MANTRYLGATIKKVEMYHDYAELRLSNKKSLETSIDESKFNEEKKRLEGLVGRKIKKYSAYHDGATVSLDNGVELDVGDEEKMIESSPIINSWRKPIYSAKGKKHEEVMKSYIGRKFKFSSRDYGIGLCEIVGIHEKFPITFNVKILKGKYAGKITDVHILNMEPIK
jgi:hypothetical protein